MGVVYELIIERFKNEVNIKVVHTISKFHIVYRCVKEN
jgi:hypothetical protein